VPSGLDRTSEMLEVRGKNKSEVIMMGKIVKIFPKYGSSFCGLFIGDKIRLHEFSREDALVVETSPGTRVYIKREDISHVAVSDCGFVNDGSNSINEINMVKKMFDSFNDCKI